VTQVRTPPEHGRDLLHRFDFHGGAGSATIQSMIVRVDILGQGVGQPGHGVGRLEHLAGIEGVEVWIIVPHTISDPE
jgi:hypothetical protein